MTLYFVGQGNLYCEQNTASCMKYYKFLFIDDVTATHILAGAPDASQNDEGKTLSRTKVDAMYACLQIGTLGG
jgi:hypothetical protein